MKSFFATLIFTMTFCKLSSQSSFYENTFGNTGRIYNLTNYDIMSVETKGSRYFNNETYVKGELKTPDSLYQNDLLFRYDQIDSPDDLYRTRIDLKYADVAALFNFHGYPHKSKLYYIHITY